ncbi:sugar transferase [Ethanoligenens sp.]|uniref:sugar transferase n=1 Tax=Ethanoligenens sp. TaxID=2099655 RepID=UPI0039E98CA0
MVIDHFDRAGNTVSALAYAAREESSTSDWYLRIGKRLFDLFTALIGCVLFSPLMLGAAVGVRLESKGPVIFKQERLGLGGKTFVIYKFRSMRIDAEASGPAWAKKNDGRITRFGRFLRKYHVDELPQLVNILRGDMSMVGPRPERAYFYAQFERDIPEFRDRLAVKPGLTGWAQVNGGYDIGPKDKCRLDKSYIRCLSLLTDCLILLKTVTVVFKGLGAR